MLRIIKTLPLHVKLVIVVSLACLVALAIALAVNRGTEPVQPEVATTETPIASPSPNLEESVPQTISEQDPQDRNPILEALPHDTRYWRLTLRGGPEGAYVLQAIVYRREGWTDEAVVAEQRPHIEAFIRSTGQPDGGYTVEYLVRDPEDVNDG